MKQVPQQKNEYDCGLFVLYFMQRFIEEAPERLKKQDLEMVLLSILLFISFSQALFSLGIVIRYQFGRKWFEPEEASGLRRKIRNLLREEFKNAK